MLVSRNLDSWADAAHKESENIALFNTDLQKHTAATLIVSEAIRRFGRLDGLVINHGAVEPIERIEDARVEEWEASFNLNVFSAVALTQAAVPELRKTSGRIILTSSGAAVKATSAWGCYGMTKACLNHLAMTLAKEEPEIISIAVRPGVVDTEMQATLASTHFPKMENEDAERFRRMNKEGKMLRPEQPGNIMARLVLEAPSDLNGKFVKYVLID